MILEEEKLKPFFEKKKLTFKEKLCKKNNKFLQKLVQTMKIDFAKHKVFSR